MSFARSVALAVLLFGSSVFAQGPPAPRDVTFSRRLTAPALKGTYYAAAKPGPAVLLLHMCNTTRKSWEPLGPQLAAAGIHALSVDYRGFGESGGDRFDALPPQDAQNTINEKWPGDIDTRIRFPARAARRGQDARRRRRRQLRRQPGRPARTASSRSPLAGAARGPARPEGLTFTHRDATGCRSSRRPPPTTSTTTTRPG